MAAESLDGLLQHPNIGQFVSVIFFPVSPTLKIKTSIGPLET
jgi:hypothetical protein